jgi:hypothetical protein
MRWQLLNNILLTGSDTGEVMIMEQLKINQFESEKQEPPT